MIIAAGASKAMACVRQIPASLTDQAVTKNRG
jgi:hypothetical protein